MADILKQWLKHHLDRMVSVQNTVGGNSDADLVIFTWTGAKIYLHLLNEQQKLRTIKRIVQDATSVGTNTLFVVNSDLLPSDGQQLVPPEWLMAIHHLTNDLIYGYRLSANRIEIIPVHFTVVNNHADEIRAWYGPAILPQRLRYYRISLRPRMIKGEWLVADFDTPAFWRTNDYRFHRTQEERQARYGRRTTWKTWEGQNSNNGTLQSPHVSYLEFCYQTLGVQVTASRDEVKAAFRRQAIAYHPDTSTLPREEAEAKFRELNRAYDYIKSINGWT